MRYFIIIPSLLLFARNVRAGCYFPDGTLDKNVEYQPCSEDSSNPLSTICCATNRKDGADICAPNGLCQVGTKKGSPPADAAWTKPSCTNQDWSEDGCLHVCGTDKYPFLTPCNRAAGNESQRWCCGMTQDCCNDDSGRLSIEYLPITFDPKNFTDTAPSSSSSASSKPTSSATKASPSSTDQSTSTSAPHSTTPAASSTHSPNSTPTPAPPPSAGLSTGAKAGLGIGITLAALAFLGLGILWGRRRSTRKEPAYKLDPAFEGDAAPLEKYAHWDHSMGGTSVGGGSHQGDGAPPATPRRADDEMQIQVHEMPVWESRGELDGKEVGNKGLGKDTYA
ncbi:hypothetical protein DPSP01_003784 [Paraphaeosphaeria sporulosa]|uniref:Mid2 domain-containing protein n=1 Tax=Paraphaeosphaeria sporulosa TaxID=1460663 RepID=A0A177CSQ0_9PLEO|nr:uncharacterized protein CC84DRAFT_1202532 [Paraphaeosphaeria sporulosa]OAG09962.1 hypothetical protein CC84DRAFT_1202532 [Paraphaeosphaeria sporulosa]